jgi:hypothetical protein
LAGLKWFFKSKVHRKGCLIAISLALGGPLLFILFILGIGWGIQRDLKRQRKELFDACAKPTALEQLEAWADPFFGQAKIPNDADRLLPASFQNLRVYHDIHPMFDSQHRVIGVMLWCGGADNHFGLIISPSSIPPEDHWPIKKQLAEHVWFYDEVPKLGYP